MGRKKKAKTMAAQTKQRLKTNKKHPANVSALTKAPLPVKNKTSSVTMQDGVKPSDKENPIKPSNKENVTSFPDLFSALCFQSTDTVIMFSSDGWECKKCNHTEKLNVDSLPRLSDHLLRYHSTDTMGLNREKFQNASDSGSMVPRKCPHCGLVRKNLAKHVEKFHLEPYTGRRSLPNAPKKINYKYACFYPGCEAAYNDHRRLVGHVASKHEKKKQHVCTLCTCSYSNKYRLTTHMRLRHPASQTSYPPPVQTRKRTKYTMASEGPRPKKGFLETKAMQDSTVAQQDAERTIKSSSQDEVKPKSSDVDVSEKYADAEFSSEFNSELSTFLGDDVDVQVHFDVSKTTVHGVHDQKRGTHSAKSEKVKIAIEGDGVAQNKKLRKSARKQNLSKRPDDLTSDDSDTEVYTSEDDNDVDDDADSDWGDDEQVDESQSKEKSRPGRPRKSEQSRASKSVSETESGSEHLQQHSRKASFARRIPVAYDTFASFYRHQVEISLPVCKFCHHPFVDEQTRDAHVKHYEGQQSGKCSGCDKVFHNLDTLNVHVLFDHSEDTSAGSCYSCKDMTDSKRGIVKHMAKCHAMSSCLSAEQLHLDSMVTEECNICKQQLLSDPQLIALHHRAHRRASNPRKPFPAVVKAFTKAKRTSKDGPSGTRCCTCERVFKNKYLAFFHAWFDHKSDDLPFQGAAVLDLEMRTKIRQLVEEEQASKTVKSGTAGDDKVSFWCGVCGTTLHDRRMKVIKHLGLHHNRLFANTATYFNKKHGMEDDQRVRMTYQCPECKEEILDIRNRVGFHRLTHGHVDDTNRHLKCRYCPAFFFCVSRVKRHERTKHAAHASDFAGMCDTCGSHFTSQRAMDEHMKLHNQTLINCDVCNRGFKTQEAMEKHRLKHDQDQYCCPHCGEQYMGKNSLNKHIKREHEKVQDPRYKCKMCPAFFSDVIEIRDHIATKHEGRKPYPCSLCSDSFGTRPTLMRHMRREHEGLSPFVCDTCGQSFHEKYILQRHMVEHGAPDPFLCPFCQKSLRNQLAVQKHIRKVHKETLSFSCDKCGLRFPSHDELTKHHKRYCSFKRKEKKEPAATAVRSESSGGASNADNLNVSWSTVFEINSPAN